MVHYSSGKIGYPTLLFPVQYNRKGKLLIVVDINRALSMSPRLAISASICASPPHSYVVRENCYPKMGRGVPFGADDDGCPWLLVL